MTVAVTGATGHIGANLVHALIKQNTPTRCLVHKHHKAIDGLDVEQVHGDLRDVESLSNAFKGVDTVYHLAATISLSMGGWQQLEEINVSGTANVIEACKRQGVKRLVHFSSIHALTQEPLDTPVNEERPSANGNSLPPYDRSKAVGERIVRQAIEQGLNAVIIYPTAAFGPYDYQPSFFGEALMMIAQRRLPALVNGGFDWVDARDVAKGAMLAAEKAPAGSRYLISGHWLSMCDIAKVIAEITGANTEKWVCPLWLAHVSAPFIEGYCNISHKRPLYTRMSLHTLNSNKHISHEKATRELGYQPRAFRETLTDTLQWFEKNSKINLLKKL